MSFTNPVQGHRTDVCIGTPQSIYIIRAMYMYTYIHTYTYIYIHTYMHMHTHKCIHNAHTYMQVTSAHAHTYMHMHAMYLLNLPKYTYLPLPIPTYLLAPTTCTANCKKKSRHTRQARHRQKTKQRKHTTEHLLKNKTVA